MTFSAPTGCRNVHPQLHRSLGIPDQTLRHPPERGDRTAAAVTAADSTRPSNDQGWRCAPDGPQKFEYRADRSGDRVPSTLNPDEHLRQ